VLGGALLSFGDGAGAEKVFRAELEKHPRNGRALFGLAESLRKQGKESAAKMVDVEFGRAWQNADTKLTVNSLVGVTNSTESTSN
jgi:TolA-binding protein